MTCFYYPRPKGWCTFYDRPKGSAEMHGRIGVVALLAPLRSVQFSMVGYNISLLDPLRSVRFSSISSIQFNAASCTRLLYS